MNFLKNIAPLFLIPALCCAQNLNEDSIAKGNTAFAIDLYQQIKNKKGNVFFSPLSISTALAMAYAGSTGETEAQMKKTMHFGSNDDSFHGYYQKYLNQLLPEKKEGVELAMANRLFVDKNFKLSDSFLKTTKDNYSAPAENVDFSNNPQESCVKINEWVKSTTRGKINEIVYEPIINKETKLVLTNAIYFKGEWDVAFDEKNTKNRAFTKDDNSTVQVPFMARSGKIELYKDKLFAAVKMPYKGNTHSMIILLPNDKTQISELEQALTAESYFNWQNSFRKASVDLLIPKFKIEFALPLKKELVTMGMPRAFEQGFFKIAPPKDLCITEVLHKAFIEVNEKGAEAAAVTAVVMTATKSVVMHEPPFQFIADHPFIYMIVDNSTKSILFMGRMSNPAK